MQTKIFKLRWLPMVLGSKPNNMWMFWKEDGRPTSLEAGAGTLWGGVQGVSEPWVSVNRDSLLAVVKSLPFYLVQLFRWSPYSKECQHIVLLLNKFTRQGLVTLMASQGQISRQLGHCWRHTEVIYLNLLDCFSRREMKCSLCTAGVRVFFFKWLNI